MLLYDKNSVKAKCSRINNACNDTSKSRGRENNIQRDGVFSENDSLVAFLNFHMNQKYFFNEQSLLRFLQFQKQAIFRFNLTIPYINLSSQINQYMYIFQFTIPFWPHPMSKLIIIFLFGWTISFLILPVWGGKVIEASFKKLLATRMCHWVED